MKTPCASLLVAVAGLLGVGAPLGASAWAQGEAASDVALATEGPRAIALGAYAARVGLTRGMTVAGLAQSGRRAVNVDGLVHAWATGGVDLTKPLPEGAVVKVPAAMKEGGRELVWEAVKAGENGAFGEGLKPGALVWVEVESAADRVMMLEASGHAVVYVNGEPRMGDPYGTGSVKVPVKMNRGVNVLVFAWAGRSEMKAELVKPESDRPFFSASDRTVGDVVRLKEGVAGVRHETGDVGLVVVNPTDKPVRVALVTGRTEAREALDAKRAKERWPEDTSELPRVMLGEITHLPPCGVAKMSAPYEAVVKSGEKTFELAVWLMDTEGSVDPIAKTTVSLAVVAEDATRKVSFKSAMDGSAQYFAVVPPKGFAEPESTRADRMMGTTDEKAPGLVLSLHGASVEAINQAQSYSAKDDFVIVCPTNRRPFGFDWEDWGRIDGLEVLEYARAKFMTNRLKQYVTGHSMGGHGTWQFGVLFPDQFAAAAPSAGWLTFETYGGGGKPVSFPGSSEKSVGMEGKLRAAAASSDTIAQLGALKGKQVAILHGDADETVPVSEAQRGRDELVKLGFVMAGKEGEESAVTLRYHEQKGAGHWWDDEDPGAKCTDWPGFFEMFRSTKLDAPAGWVTGLVGTTEQDARHQRKLLDWRGFSKGSFKRVFDRGFMLVYGTKGTAEENAWSMAKARFDGEQWWVRGNGRANVLSDVEFVKGEYAASEGNVVVYGNAQVNGAWSLIERELKAQGEGVEGVRVGAGAVDGLGEKLEGGDVGVLLAVQRKPGDLIPGPTFGLIGGTGIAGMRAIERVPLFTSGAGIPEVFVVRAKVWNEGMPGVERAGVLGEVVGGR